jgi:xylose dehydrogenase (NAD/NADP)
MGESSAQVAPLRWGILGPARIVRRLVEPIRAAGHSITAIASRSLERAESAARQWEIPRALGGYDALLADPDVDVIYLPLPNALHAEWTVKAAEAGKHVLCEKPLAVTIADVDRIIDAAARHGVVVAEAFMYRHHPATDAARRLIAEGVVGEVRYLRGVFSFILTRPLDVRLDPALGGGSLWDIGCYPVSWMRTVLGAEPRSVAGVQPGEPDNVDRAFFGVLRFSDAVVGQFACSFDAPNREEIEVTGSTGVLRIARPFRPGLSEVFQIERDGQPTERIEVEGRSLYQGEIEDMARAIREGTPPRVTLQDSLKNVRTILALYESARSGREVLLQA